jgi:hypothetical protein
VQNCSRLAFTSNSGRARNGQLPEISRNVPLVQEATYLTLGEN